MKNLFLPVVALVGFFACASTSHASPVEYVKICSQIGSQDIGPGFFYIPGSDGCINPQTGEALFPVATANPDVYLIWRTFLPLPEGAWVGNPQQQCPGSLVKVGSFKSTDFTLNVFNRKQTAPVSLKLNSSQFISEVIMSGGFYIPALAGGRSGLSLGGGMCLRSIDPSVLEKQADGSLANPPYGNNGLPIGCINNTRIVGMPEAYAITSTAAYPEIDAFFRDAAQDVSGPYVYGSSLVVTTDDSTGNPQAILMYADVNQVLHPLAGTLNVWACVEGPNGNGQGNQGNQNGNGQ